MGIGKGSDKVWVAVNMVMPYSDEVVVSTVLSEVCKELEISYWKGREARRKHGEGGFLLRGKDGFRHSWWVTRVKLRKVEGRGKGGQSGYKLKSKG